MPEPTSLLTLFACPKAFKGHDAIIQTNALRNWKYLRADVILLGDDPGVAEAAATYGYRHIAEIQKTEYGTPLLSDIFAKAQTQAETPLICYSNADILYPSSFPRMAASVQTQLSKPFLLVGQRWDVDIEQPLSDVDFTKTGLAALRKRGTLHLPCGIDYFLFLRGDMKLPPFAVGRPGWDNWMIWDAKRRGLCVIDATEAVEIIHQNHGYTHVPGGVGQKWMGSPEAAYNACILAKISPTVRWGEVTVCDAGKRLTQDGKIRPNLSAKRGICFFSLYRQRVKHWLWDRRSLIKKILGGKTYAFLKNAWHRMLRKT